MRRPPSILFTVFAFLAAALFYASLHGWRFTRGDAASASPSSFHGGKKTPSAKRDSPCFAPRCHAPSTHRKPTPTSAFLNMHETVVSCLGCHGLDSERRWKSGGSAGEGALRLAYSPVPELGPGARRHDANGPPAPCRRCHSTDGRRAIAAAGVKGLHEGFEEPIVIGMIEGGGRKWLPDDMR